MRGRDGRAIEIPQNSLPIADLGPAPRLRTISAEQWRVLMADLPAVDDGFAEDTSLARAKVGPADGKWPS